MTTNPAATVPLWMPERADPVRKRGGSGPPASSATRCDTRA